MSDWTLSDKLLAGDGVHCGVHLTIEDVKEFIRELNYTIHRTLRKLSDDGRVKTGEAIYELIYELEKLTGKELMEVRE